MAEDKAIDIEYLSKLARVELSDAEKAAFSGQLKEILAHFHTLSEVDVSGIEPMAHPFNSENCWRSDKVREEWSIEQSLANAPQTRANQIVVPKVVEDA